jgi:phage anti-repressor protein
MGRNAGIDRHGLAKDKGGVMMNDLIKIDPAGRTTARELYEFLQMNRTQFSRWAKTNIECNSFYQKGQDWEGFDMMSNGNQTRDYRLTLDFAKHLCMLSRSARGKQARDYFVEVETRFNKQLRPANLEDLIILQVTAMKEIRQAQMLQGAKLKQLAAKLETSPAEFFTIAGFASLRGARVDVNKAALLGRMASSISKKFGYDIGKTHDPRFGQVNTYHSDILAQVFTGKC